MNLLTFVKDCTTPDFFERYKTVCLRSRGVPPLLFFSRLFKKMKTDVDLSVETICLDATDPASVMAKLSTSFLGNSSLYWLKSLSDLKTKKRKQLFSFLKTYNGPNSAAFFIDETITCTAKDFQLIVDVPERVDQKFFMQLAQSLNGGGEKLREESVVRVFKKTKTVGLDNACVLAQYLRLAGRGADEFMEHWLDKIVAPEYSLSELSTVFFSRDTKAFFTLWKKMGQGYSAQFWISFWSEQLWRACNFVQQSKNRQFIEAKRISFRLPYNFTQRLWRDANVLEFRSAHKFLYSVDYSLKNGGSDFSLELFYTKFFERQFKSGP